METKNVFDYSKMSQILTLFNCAMSDGHFVESERSLLMDIAKRLEVNKNTIESIITSEQNFQYELPKTQEERMQHLIDLVFMMMIDCKISMSELNFCKKIANKIGFHSNSIEYLISQVLKDISSELSEVKLNYNSIQKSIN